jgi:8-oxo-dGTP pyrophosphatase MutT (NUDIX family)
VADYVRRLRGIVGGDELLQVPSVSIALRDADGRVLLARHAEGDVWLLPGGAIEPAETPSDAAVREMFEETGLLVRLSDLVGVFGGPEFIVRYRNGHQTSYVMAVFEAELDAGSLRPDAAEVLELRFVSVDEAEALPKAAWVDEVLGAVFRREHARRFRPATWQPTMPSASQTIGND